MTTPISTTTTPSHSAPSDVHDEALALTAAASTDRSPVRRGARAMRALASDIGQGTVEYVGLLLLMATVLAAVVGAASKLGGEDQIGKKVVQQVGKSIEKAGNGER